MNGYFVRLPQAGCTEAVIAGEAHVVGEQDGNEVDEERHRQPGRGTDPHASVVHLDCSLPPGDPQHSQPAYRRVPCMLLLLQ